MHAIPLPDRAGEKDAVFFAGDLAGSVQKENGFPLITILAAKIKGKLAAAGKTAEMSGENGGLAFCIIALEGIAEGKHPFPLQDFLFHCIEGKMRMNEAAALDFRAAGILAAAFDHSFFFL